MVRHINFTHKIKDISHRVIPINFFRLNSTMNVILVYLCTPVFNLCVLSYNLSFSTLSLSLTHSLFKKPFTKELIVNYFVIPNQSNQSTSRFIPVTPSLLSNNFQPPYSLYCVNPSKSIEIHRTKLSLLLRSRHLRSYSDISFYF